MTIHKHQWVSVSHEEWFCIECRVIKTDDELRAAQVVDLGREIIKENNGALDRLEE